MAAMINPIDDFKVMLDKDNKPYIDLGMGLLVILSNNGFINVRQYHNDGVCLSSWVEKEAFEKEINELLGKTKGE